MAQNLNQIAESLKDIKGAKHAPVHLWNPDNCGSIPLDILDNGDWHYMGTPIERRALVELFATVLYREEVGKGPHFLITPHEKIEINVFDSAFVVTDFEMIDLEGQKVLRISTNLAGEYLVGKEHPIRFDQSDDQFKAYVQIRYGLEAKFSRSQMMTLADHLIEDGAEYKLVSQGEVFYCHG